MTTTTTTASQPNAAPSVERNAIPVAWLKFWAAQHSDGNGGIDQDEGYEVCREGEIGVDGEPAFPVYAAAPALPEPAAAQGPTPKPVKVETWHDNVSEVTRSTYKLCTCAAAPQPLAEVSAAQGVPEGFKLVPVGPTPKMIGRGRAALYDPRTGQEISVMFVERCYRAMLDAAPVAQPTDTTREA